MHVSVRKLCFGVVTMGHTVEVFFSFPLDVNPDKPPSFQHILGIVEPAVFRFSCSHFF